MEKIELVIISMEIAEHKKLFDNISFRHRINHLPGKKTVFILLFFFPFTNPIHVENRKTCLGNRISLRRKDEKEKKRKKKACISTIRRKMQWRMNTIEINRGFSSSFPSPIKAGAFAFFFIDVKI